MKAAVIAFSGRGERQAEKLCGALARLGWEAGFERCPPGGLAQWTERNFNECEALVFVSSAGIAVRAVAPHIKSKLSDPAVLAADEGGGWLVPLLSGHAGGANELARRLAPLTGAQPVITTATDINGLFAADVWAGQNGLVIANPERVKRISARLLAGERVTVESEFPLRIADELSGQLQAVDGGGDIVISTRRQDGGALWLIPRRLILGAGCRRGTDAQSLEDAFGRFCEAIGRDGRALCAVATIDIKSDEAGLLQFCQSRGVPPVFFPAGRLAGVKGEFSHSGFVRDTVGVDNVCERAAIAAGGAGLIGKKAAFGGVALAAALSEGEIYIGTD